MEIWGGVSYICGMLNSIIRRVKAQTLHEQTKMAFDIISLAKGYRNYLVANQIWFWLLSNPIVSISFLFGDCIEPNPQGQGGLRSPYSWWEEEETDLLFEDWYPQNAWRFPASRLKQEHLPTSQKNCEWSNYHALVVLSFGNQSATIPAPMLGDSFWENPPKMSLGWRTFKENTDGMQGKPSDFWIAPENIGDYLIFFE